MKDKKYTYFSLAKGHLLTLFIVLAVLDLLITQYPYTSFNLEKWLLQLPFSIFMMVFIGSVLGSFLRMSNVIVINAEGVKFYGLFNKERFISWQEIQTFGCYSNFWGNYKESDIPKGFWAKFFAPPKTIIVSSEPKEIAEKLQSDIKKTIIRLPYHSGIYNQIKQRLG